MRCELIMHIVGSPYEYQSYYSTRPEGARSGWPRVRGGHKVRTRYQDTKGLVGRRIFTGFLDRVTCVSQYSEVTVFILFMTGRRVSNS